MATATRKIKGVDLSTTMQIIQNDIFLANVDYRLLFKLVNGIKKTGNYKRFQEVFFYFEQAIVDQYIFNLAKIFSIHGDESLIKFIDGCCEVSQEIFELRMARYPSAPHEEIRKRRQSFIRGKERFIKRIQGIERKINPLRNTQRAHNFPLRKRGASVQWNKTKYWLIFAEVALFKSAEAAGLNSFRPGNYIPREIDFRIDDTAVR